jgi:hypothetical protein
VSLVTDPTARAAAIGDGQRSAAAQLHADLEAELALNDDLDPAWEQNAENALDDLEGRFGGAERLRELGVDRGKTPRLSGGARKGLNGPHEGRRRSGSGSGSTAGAPAGGPKASGGRRAATGGRSTPARRGSRRAGRGGRSLGRAWQRTGVPGAADNATGVALQLAGLTIGLVLLYSVVRGRGPEAVQIASRSFLSGLRLFVSPIDPLGKAPSAGAPAGRADFLARTPGYLSVVQPGNAYERGVAAGVLAGPARPRAPIRRPPNAPAPGGRRPT